jgi:hypothetical protein
LRHGIQEGEVNMSPTAFIDLDGVLVDFVSGVLAAHGARLPPREICWDFNTQLGLTAGEFWAPCGKDFWESLSWTHEGPALLEAVEKVFGDNVVVLTSPCKTAGAVEGKVEWIRRNMPKYARRYFVGPPKHLLAGAGKLLIDDHDDNAKKFAAHGGRVVLVPRPWNARRDDTDELGRFDVQRMAEEIAASI